MNDQPDDVENVDHNRQQLRSPLWIEVAAALIRLPMYFRIALALHNMPDATMQYQPQPLPPLYLLDETMMSQESGVGRWNIFPFQKHRKASWQRICRQMYRNSRAEIRFASHRPVSPRAIRRMAAVLPRATNLELLALDGIDLSDTSVSLLCEALTLLLQRQQQEAASSSSSLSTFRELSLGWNSFSSVGVGELMNVLAPDAAITSTTPSSVVPLATTAKGTQRDKASWVTTKHNTKPSHPTPLNIPKVICQLQVLKLTGNSLGVLGARKVAQALPCMPTLIELHLGDCRLRDGGVKTLSRVLPTSSVQLLRLDRNGITNEGAYCFAEVFKYHCSGGNRRVAASSASSTAAVAIAKGKTCCALQVLHLTGNDIEWGGARELLEMASVMDLNELWLGVNQIIRPRPFSWVLVMPIIHGANHHVESDTICHLQTLNLNGNYLGDTGAILVADLVLRRSSWLRELSLAGARIGDRGAMALASALRDNVKLERLILSGNHGITETGRAMFTDVVRDYNMSLRKLVLDNDLQQQNISSSSDPRIDCPNRSSLLSGNVQDWIVGDELDYYILLNAMGRELLCNLDTPASIWPFLLSYRSPRVMYAFLQYRPEMVSSR